MKKILLLLALITTLTVLAFTKFNKSDAAPTSMMDYYPAKSLKDPYKIEYSLHKITNTSYEVKIQMLLLDSNAYFVSPQSKDKVTGAFSVDFGDTNHISLVGDLMEFPIAQLRGSEFGPRMIHEVHENTTYSQTFELKTAADFYMIGRVRFVIEPKCTLEVLHFGLKMESGKLTVIENIDC
jgi:hypothetical protein